MIGANIITAASLVATLSDAVVALGRYKADGILTKCFWILGRQHGLLMPRMVKCMYLSPMSNGQMEDQGEGCPRDVVEELCEKGDPCQKQER